MIVEMKWILMVPHPLTNFEIQKYYQNGTRFNCVYSRNNLLKKIKDGTLMNMQMWIALFCNRNDIVYFDSFGVEYGLEEIKEFVGNKNVKANVFQVQVNNSIICGYFCIGFTDFMLSCKKTN